MPCNGNDGKVVGVIQLINKEGGGMFTGEDVELMQSFLLIAGPVSDPPRFTTNFLKNVLRLNVYSF